MDKGNKKWTSTPLHRDSFVLVDWLVVQHMGRDLRNRRRGGYFRHYKKYLFSRHIDGINSISFLLVDWAVVQHRGRDLRDRRRGRGRLLHGWAEWREGPGAFQLPARGAHRGRGQAGPAQRSGEELFRASRLSVECEVDLPLSRRVRMRGVMCTHLELELMD